MAVDSNALTLIEYAQWSNAPLIEKEVAFSMVKAGVVFQDIPTITRPTFKMPAARVTGALPAPAWRDVNEETSAVKTNASRYEDTFYSWATPVICDELVQMEENAIGRSGSFVNNQMKGVIMGSMYDLNDAFINNTHRVIANRARTANPKCFVGIRERLDNADFGMRSSETKIQSTADLSSVTDTVANTFIEEMQSVMDAMGNPEGDGLRIYANDQLVRKIEKGIRALGAGGGFDMTKDAFGRMVVSYRNALIRRIGRKAPAADGSQAYIITSTETQNGAADTGSTYTSMYFVNFGMDAMYAWQFFAPKVEAETTDDNTIIKRVVHKGGYGLQNVDVRSIGRLHGIKMA